MLFIFSYMESRVFNKFSLFFSFIYFGHKQFFPSFPYLLLETFHSSETFVSLSVYVSVQMRRKKNLDKQNPTCYTEKS